MRLLLCTVAAFCALCSGQSFEVASIHMSAFQKADGEGSRREAIQTSPDGLTMRNVTLRDCMSWAYNLQDFQVAGAASEAVERYDVAARASGPASTAKLRIMLQNLLADRFKVTFHRETKMLSAYALVVGKGGTKLRESNEDSPAVMRPGKVLSVAHASMWEFAGMLAGPLRTPVIDKTGLTGRYDFTVDLSAYLDQSTKTSQIDLPGAVMSALKNQLGLTLESRKEQVELFVIDHAEESPTQN